MSTAIRAITRVQDADDFAGTPTDGQVLAYDGDLAKWSPLTISGGVTDHGALTGLGDDDHPQYALDADLAAYLPLAGGTVAGNVTVTGYLVSTTWGMGGGGAAPRIYTPGFGIISFENGSGFGGRFYNFYTYDNTHPEIRAGGFSGASLVLSGENAGAIARTSAATGVALHAQGASGQTADIQRWITSAGTVLGSVSPTGLHTISQLAGTNGPTLRLVPAPEPASGNVMEVITRNPGSATVGFAIGAYGSVAMSAPTINTAIVTSASLEWWGPGDRWQQQWNEYGYSSTPMAYLSSLAAPTKSARLWLQSPNTVGVHTVRLQAMASQSGDLLRLEDSASAVLFSIGATGQIRTAQTAANTNTPSGGTSRQLPIYDAAGSLLGYVPVYASPW